MSEKDSINIEETTQTKATTNKKEEVMKIVEWVSNLKSPELRVSALIELSKQRDSFSDLALYLWYSPGVISSL